MGSLKMSLISLLVLLVSASMAQTPRSAKDYFRRAEVHYELHNFSAAIADDSKAIERDPQFAAAYNNRAAAWFALNFSTLASEG
jgi:tetratricopeptide (TPR) repeat protein